MAFFISIMITPFIKGIANRLGVIDHPGKRKVHTEGIPKLGGISIFCGFIFSILIIFKIYGLVLTKDLKVILIGALLVLILGILDDMYNIQAPIKFLAQLLIAYFVVSMGLKIMFISNPLTMNVLYLKSFTNVVSVLWIVILMNSINLIDGLDGLAAGIVTISSFSLFVIAIVLGEFQAAVILIALAGATLGFLRFNFVPATIFMGDAGSLLLGYLLAVSAIEGVLKSSVSISLAIPMLSLLIPLSDTAHAVIRRIKNGKHIFKADAEHIHHKLLYKGYTHKQAVLLIYYSTFILNLIAVLLSFTSGLFSAVLFVLFVAVIISIFVKFKGFFQSE